MLANRAGQASVEGVHLRKDRAPSCAIVIQTYALLAGQMASCHLEYVIKQRS